MIIGDLVGKTVGAYLFGSMTQEVAKRMRAGSSVCLEGEWGSGKSTLFKDVTTELERTDVTLLSCRGHELLTNTPTRLYDK